MKIIYGNLKDNITLSDGYIFNIDSSGSKKIGYPLLSDTQSDTVNALLLKILKRLGATPDDVIFQLFDAELSVSAVFTVYINSSIKFYGQSTMNKIGGILQHAGIDYKVLGLNDVTDIDSGDTYVGANFEIQNPMYLLF